MDTANLTIWLQLLTIVVSVLIVVIGFVFNKIQDVSREKRKYKADLYLEYISISNQIDDDHPDAKIDMEYSGSVEKLCLYANRKVLKKIAEFHDKYYKTKKIIKTKKWQDDYADIVLSMRKDIGKSMRKIDNNMVKDILELYAKDAKNDMK